MDLINEFHVYIAVAETGSFSAAARALRLSPSAVSKLIQRVENRVGVRLFDRSAKSALLTREGEAYLKSVQQVIDAMADVQTLADSLTSVPNGTLRIHTTPSFADGQLTPLLPEFLALHPDLNLEFRLGPKFVGLADDMDIAIQFGTLSDSSLVLRKLATSRRVLCASPEYLRLRGTPADPSDLPRHVLLNYTMPGRDTWPLRSAGQMRDVPVDAKISADQADVLVSLALGGVGIARVPEYHVFDHVAAGRLVTLMTDFAFTESIYAVVRTRRNLSPRMRVFIDFVEQKLRGKAWNLDTR
ncbi:LysR family transcriptional regulator [soil metagenome]